MLLLNDLVRVCTIKHGQLAIPLSAFNFTFDVLERSMIDAVRYFEQWYPLEKTVNILIGIDPVKLPDAINVVSVKPNIGSFSSYSPRLEKRAYKFVRATKEITGGSNISATVDYIAHYPIRNASILQEDQSFLEGEPDLFFNILGSFKQSSLVVSLKEDDLTGAILSVNTVTDEFTINPVVGAKLYTKAKIRFTGTTLPTPLSTGVDYYIIKLSDTIFRVCSSIQDAIDGIYIDVTTSGSTDLVFSRTFFTLREDISSYKNFKSVVDSVSTSNNTIILKDILFNRRLDTGEVITFTNVGGGLPAPLVSGTEYFVTIVDEFTLRLSTTLENALLGVYIDITTAGTGVHTANKINDTLVDDNKFVHCYGDLGSMEVDLSVLTSTFFNLYGLQGDLSITYISKYKSVEGLDLDENYSDFFKAVFEWYLLNGLGRHKNIINLESLPINITADDLLTLQQDYATMVKEYTETRSKFYLF